MEHIMPQTFPILETPRLRLRQPQGSDVQAYLALSQDADVMRYFGRAPLASEDEAVEVLKWIDNLFEMKTGIEWIIADVLTDACLGEIGFPAPEYVAEHARAALGFKLAKAWWQQGLMTEALQRVVTYGFEEFGLNRIEAMTDSRNIACQKLLEKCRFVKEGVLRDYERDQDGFIDLVMYASLRRDWKRSPD